MRGGGRLSASTLLFLTILLFGWAQFQLEEQYGDVSTDPASSELLQMDFGRIIAGYPRTDIRICVPSGLAPIAFYTSILGGQSETYYIAPGGVFERLDLRRSFWEVRGQGFSQNPSRFNLVGRTLFELKYRSDLPVASREILRDLYSWQQQLRLEYLSFLAQRSYARLALNQGNWAVSVDLLTRLCHNDTGATLEQDCSGVAGDDNCADIGGRLQINRNSASPGADCSTGACYWYDPASRYGDVYHRSWRAGTLTLNFDWSDNRQTGTVQTPASGGSVECNRIQLTPDNNNWVRLSASSETYKGLILMRRRAFPDRMKSLDPLGFPELGDNELVFTENAAGVQLKTAMSAWVIAEPQESFLLRIPTGDGGEIVISDMVEWFAYRIYWRTGFPFRISWNRYGYVHDLANRVPEGIDPPVSLGKIFIWNFADYSAQQLPDYNPGQSSNLLGAHEMKMEFRPTANSLFTVIGRARYEVFFPATGNRCPPGAVSEPEGLTIPNWFFYYWRAVGSPAVVFTNQAPAYVRGFYEPGLPYVYVCDHSQNYTTTSFPLFAIRPGECPENIQHPVVTEVDTLTVHGIHAFAHVVFHEFGHKWSYTTLWQGVPIAGSPGRNGDSDIDGLLDAWEAVNGLCPHRPHTTDAYPQYDEASDAEVLAGVIAYGMLFTSERCWDQRTGQWRWCENALWRHDWSNLGVQYGDPVERFGAFPWKYSSSGKNYSNHPDLLTGWIP